MEDTEALENGKEEVALEHESGEVDEEGEREELGVSDEKRGIELFHSFLGKIGELERRRRGRRIGGRLRRYAKEKLGNSRKEVVREEVGGGRGGRWEVRWRQMQGLEEGGWEIGGERWRQM